jgi:hypothetical protein
MQFGLFSIVFHPGSPIFTKIHFAQPPCNLAQRLIKEGHRRDLYRHDRLVDQVSGLSAGSFAKNVNRKTSSSILQFREKMPLKL